MSTNKLILGVTVAAASLLAQPPRAFHGDGGPGGGPAGPGFAREARVVKGQPYSADVVTESVQVLSDGNRIVRKSTGAVYRDSEGRMRRESSGPGSASASAERRNITISDPVAGVELQLQPDQKAATKAVLHGPHAGGDFGRPGPPPAVNRQGRPQRQRPNTTVEDLGTQVIEGVTAQGKRTTRLIPAGQMGNEREIKIVDEVWISPDLQVTVQSHHSDPMGGDVTYKLANVKRAEPAASLFQAPADYQVSDHSSMMHRPGGPHPPQQPPQPQQ
jgi:hypothetical protein